MPARKNITQRELAELLGLSFPTINRALTGSPLVSAKTRKRVLESAERLGYRKNLVASSLVSKKTNAIGMIGGNYLHSFWADVLEAMEQAARERGYHVIISHRSRNSPDSSEEIEFVMDRRVDGIILLPNNKGEDMERLYAITKAGVPLLNLDAYISGMPGSYLGTDGRTGSREACDYLIGLGHRDIAYVAGAEGDYVSDSRLNGWRDAMQKANLDASRVIHADGFSWKDGGKAVDILLGMSPRPTAVMAMNDPLAIGLYSSLWQSGVRIPEDISLVGYAGMREGNYLEVPLTTVVQPVEKLGQRAAQIIVGLIEGDIEEIVFEQISDELEVRQSCAAVG